MRRADVLGYFASLRTDEPVVVGPGTASSLLGAHGDDALVLHGMDMPLAAPICLGLALALKERRVVAIEGDGSILAGPGVFTTIARYAPRNLIILVFDNQAYLSPGHGDIQTATAFGTDIGGMARAAGVRGVRTVRSLQTAKGALDKAFREDGPWVIVAIVDQSDRTDPLRQNERPVDIVEAALRFRRALLDGTRPIAPSAGAPDGLHNP